MFEAATLRATLGRIDGRPYPAYRDIVGSYRLPGLVLSVDHVQADPFAAPSRVRLTFGAAEAGFADVTPAERLPLRDLLLRGFAAAVADEPLVVVPPLGPEILDRSALVWDGDDLEIRVGVDLPADSRRVLGRRALGVLLGVLPEAVAAIRRPALDGRRLRAHLQTFADQQHLSGLLAERGWVAFVGDGAILPRARGDSTEPMPASRAVPFLAPEGLAAEVELPHAGPVRGMALPRGVTLVVGGGYHGKSTLLAALAAAVYPHVPGDGRERVATVPDAVAVRVEEGRPITGVDVQAFVRGAPGTGDGPLLSAAASGSTSQAAGIAEALEMGAGCLLIDEDTSAANFMARDARMQALVPPAEEPIVPLCDRVRELWERGGVSTVLVVGGHGAFLDVADRVVRMADFRARDVSADAAAVAARLPAGRVSEAEAPWRPPLPRRPLAEAFAPALGERARIRPRGARALLWDERLLDLAALPQLVDGGQTRAIADLLRLIGGRYADGRRTLAEAVGDAFAEVRRAGLAVISPWRGQLPGEYALPRPFEVAAAINRLPTLAVAVDAAAAAGAGDGARREDLHLRQPASKPAQAPAGGARDGRAGGDRSLAGPGRAGRGSFRRRTELADAGEQRPGRDGGRARPAAYRDGAGYRAGDGPAGRSSSRRGLGAGEARGARQAGPEGRRAAPRARAGGAGGRPGYRGAAGAPRGGAAADRARADGWRGGDRRGGSTGAARADGARRAADRDAPRGDPRRRRPDGVGGRYGAAPPDARSRDRGAGGTSRSGGRGRRGDDRSGPGPRGRVAGRDHPPGASGGLGGAHTPRGRMLPLGRAGRPSGDGPGARGRPAPEERT